MCQGYFEDNSPKLDLLLVSLKLTVLGRVKFLLDTGADTTSITLEDALRLWVDIDGITNSNNQVGIEGAGGETYAYPIVDTIGFIFAEHSPQTKKMSYHIEFLDRVDLVPKLPVSVLGRDMLDKFDIEISRVAKVINLKRNDFGEGVHICFTI